MANNLMHPLEDPPSLSSRAGEREMEFISSDEEEGESHQHTILSSEEDEPEDPPPSSSGEAQLSGRKRLSEGLSTKVSSKKIYTQGKKMGSYFKRVFGEEDEIVLLQSIIDSKGKNPLKDKGRFYESMKGSFSCDVTLKQFKQKLRHMKSKYTKKEERGEQASASNPHQLKCFQLSKAVWGAQGIAFESANEKSKKRKRRVTKKLDLVSSSKGENVQDGSKKGDMEKSPHVVTKSDWEESSFFLGMDFLKEKWTKVPSETKKKTKEKMNELHANELECKKFEEMLKAKKDRCAHDKVELLNEVTSLLMGAD